jgi:hypothetical protein
LLRACQSQSRAACQAILFMQPLMQPASSPINLSLSPPDACFPMPVLRCTFMRALLERLVLGGMGGPKRNESTVLETRTTPPAPTDSGAIRVKGPPPRLFSPPWASTCRCSSRTPLYPCDGAPLWQRIEDGVQAPRRTGSSLETRQPYRPAVVLLFPVRDGSVVIERLFGSQALKNRQSSGDVSVVSNEWERTSEEEKGNKMYPFHPPAC